MAGKICWSCHQALPAPYPGRERCCETCGDRRGTATAMRRVLMRYEYSQWWSVRFSDPQNSASRFRELRFTDATKIRELVARTLGARVLEVRQALEHGLERGAGATALELIEEQYVKIRSVR